MAGRRFDSALMLGTTARCRFGRPRVIVCSPLGKGFAPFPTTFWLSCPWLVRVIGALEASGGVKELELWLTHRSVKSWRSYNREHQRLRLALLSRERRAYLSAFKPEVWERLRTAGVGGISYGFEVNVKCLHLQTASWLALGRHPGVAWLEEKGLAEDCKGQGCVVC
ncbi:MAG: DUF501 domain-containing protein [Fretibacterium sp.]|nr:DUF501 domain-containing protein [Fretibacterium sp.]